MKRKHGDVTSDNNGYLLIYHQVNGEIKRKRQHVFLAEKAIGKPLPKGALVHHVDGDGTNNSPSNLVICPNDAYHFILHMRHRSLEVTGDANKRACRFCKQYDDESSMYISGDNVYHRACHNEYMRQYWAKRKAS